MSYTEEDLRLAREWLGPKLVCSGGSDKPHAPGCQCAAESLATFRAEARREAEAERDAERKAVEQDAAQYRGILAAARREASKQASRASEAEAMLARVVAALIGLVNKVEILDKHKGLFAVFQVAAIHGQPYDGPTWTAELMDAHAALAAARKSCGQPESDHR